MRHPATLAALVLAAAACARAPLSPDPGSSGVPDELARLSAGERLRRGADLFDRHCAVCHGTFGTGDGPAAPWLFPPARDLSRGRFRLVSTQSGVPTDADLVHTIRRGIPGSAMPAWGWLAERDLWSLAAHVRRLWAEAETARLEQAGVPDPLAAATELTTPGERIEPLPLPDASDGPALLDRGRELYGAHCASCHGDDGAGSSRPRFDEDGMPDWARDFTAGFLKGGAAPQDLHHRIASGMPGTAMSATRLPDERDALALVAYVHSMIPTEAQHRLVHSREDVVVRRVDEVPVDPEDPLWSESGETPVVLAPLWWKDSSVLSAWVGGVHDGRHVALRVRWEDDTEDTRVFADGVRPDGAALQLSVDERPPLFGMGSRAQPTNLWHWRSLRLSDVAGALELAEPHALGQPFTGEARPDVPIYRPSFGHPKASTVVDALRAIGLGETAADPGAETTVVARPRWSDGEWSVLFLRAMEPPRPGDVPLLPGGEAQVALAVWNGSAGDHQGQKSISIWQRLVIEE